jgi:hypothetical protein
MISDLTNNNFKYWYRYYNDTLKPYALGFCFYKNGTFIEYENPNYDHSRRLIFKSPILSKPNWKFINDTMMMFGEGDFYEIIALNGDSLILQSVKHKDSNYLKLHRDKDQLTKPLP